ncbi:hypothetical protein K1719_030037 [Acacia pycnantha]|nr:hypothetical protein K1719_030037 [Acacia pycnantha]
MLKEVPSQNGFTLGGILVQRAWLQGVLVSALDGDTSLLVLDDGIGLIGLSLSGDLHLRPWRVGKILAGWGTGEDKKGVEWFSELFAATTAVTSTATQKLGQLKTQDRWLDHQLRVK